MNIQQYLNQQCTKHNLKWLVVVNAEGLTVCGSGVEEQFELAAMLPGWLDTSHSIAKAAKLEKGMGLICLVPRSGSFLLLTRDFEVKGERLFLLMAAPKIPQSAVKTLEGICQALKDNL